MNFLYIILIIYLTLFYSEFASILSTTPRDKIYDTTRILMFSGEGDNSDIEKTTEDIIDETTFLQSVQHSETPRSLLSSTNRASVDEQNSIIQSRTPKTFADLLPEKSLNPPQLEQATTFEDLLRPPNIFEDTKNGRMKIDLKQKRLMIQEALQISAFIFPSTIDCKSYLLTEGYKSTRLMNLVMPKWSLAIVYHNSRTW